MMATPSGVGAPSSGKSRIRHCFITWKQNIQQQKFTSVSIEPGASAIQA